MARQARLVFPGFPVHVMQRGNNRSDCFFSDGDRLRYLTLFAQLAARYDCAIHAYALMSNHVHLLLTPADVNGLSLLMRNVGQQFAQYVNRVHGRTGSLWEGRYRSSIVDSESYFLTCQRYIELNPVRAGMVNRPEDYRWSTYLANAHGRADSLITPHPQFLALGRDDDSRRTAYLRLFRNDLDDECLDRIRRAANSGGPLGSAEFVRSIDRRFDGMVNPSEERVAG
jgi:putative transposase